RRTRPPVPTPPPTSPPSPSVPASAVRAAAEQVHVDEQRAAADDLHELADGAGTALAAPELAADASALRDRGRLPLAAMHEPNHGCPGDEAAGRHGRGLDCRNRGGRAPRVRQLIAIVARLQ